VQVGEDDRVDLIGMNAQLLLKMLMHLQTATFVAFVVPLGRAGFIRQACVDQDFLVARVDVMAINRVPVLFACGSFPENIGAQIGLKPASVDRVDFRFGHAHGILQIGLSYILYTKRVFRTHMQGETEVGGISLL